MESSSRAAPPARLFTRLHTTMLTALLSLAGCSDGGGAGVTAGTGAAPSGTGGGVTAGSGATPTGSGGDLTGGTGGAVATNTGGTAGESRGPWVEPTFDPNALPTEVPVVDLIVAEELRERLDAAPFYGEDVTGAFVDAAGARHENVDVNYRGAYALLTLIESDPVGRRNWKLKFPSADRYRGRREWNYTFSPNLRQLLAYDLMRFAGVRVPSARHVLLSVNGEPQGLYLEYEDPDSKDWLWDMFGDDTGDLYKAARDMPASEGEPELKYFADTTYLGADDASYPNHYNKKTNHEDPAIANDYSVIRSFLEQLNALPDADLGSFLDARFQVDRFLSYLVVSNFISNWDGFPQRPKNFWLFEVRDEGRLAFIPWDLDGTFQQETDLFNQMGTEAPLFFNLRGLDYSPVHSEEGTERPLAWRIIADPAFETAYLARYRELSASILSEAFLTARIDALAELVEPVLTDSLTGEGWLGESTTERSDFEDALEDMRGFVSARLASVNAELAAAP